MNYDLTLAYIGGSDDCAVIAVLLNGERVCTVLLNYQGDDTNFSAECPDFPNEGIPSIFNDLHLVACVTSTIIRAYSDEAVFYSDPFFDKEGEDVTLPLFDPLKV